jgi:hypothetical protein
VSRYGTAAFVATASAILVVIVAVLLFGPRNVAAPPPSPGPTTTAATASPTSSVFSSATATAAVSGRYVSALGYSIEMPPPWRRSSCSPMTQQSADRGGEVFIPVSARDETSTDIGAPYTTLRIFVEANPQSITPRQWAEQGRIVGGQATEQIEDVIYADRPAARKSLPLSAPGTGLYRYFVANGGRMFMVDPDVRPGLETATQQALVRMIASFRFITDVEQAAARAALPTALPSRTPEQVVDAVAAAMTAKDVDALAGILSPCVTTGGENAGGTTISREKYVEDMRAAFAAGLVVKVQTRPLVGDRASGNLSVNSSWEDSRGTKERKLMLQRGENDRWVWLGTIERL